jgi:predicted transcriptional regulator
MDAKRHSTMISFRLSDADVLLLHALARRADRTRSDLLRQLLRDAAKTENLPLPAPAERAGHVSADGFHC